MNELCSLEFVLWHAFKCSCGLLALSLCAVQQKLYGAACGLNFLWEDVVVSTTPRL